MFFFVSLLLCVLALKNATRMGPLINTAFQRGESGRLNSSKTVSTVSRRKRKPKGRSMIQFILIVVLFWFLFMIIIVRLSSPFLKARKKLLRIYYEKAGKEWCEEIRGKLDWKDKLAMAEIINEYSNRTFDDEELNEALKSFKSKQNNYMILVMMIPIITFIAILSILIKGLLCLL